MTQLLQKISEIGLRRTECYGKCPVYKVVILANGSFLYIGEKHVQKLGKHTGKIRIWDLNKLFEFITEIGFMNLKDAYRNLETDHSTTYTYIVLDGQKKEIKNYGDSGPAVLWALEELIDMLLSVAEWHPENEILGLK